MLHVTPLSAQTSGPEQLAAGLAAEATYEPVQARRFFEGACKLGQAQACVEWGKMAEDGRGGPRGGELASAAYQRGCNIDPDKGCAALAKLIQEKTGDPQNFVKARNLVKKGCDAGSFDGCKSYAVELAQGWGGPAEPGRARQILMQLAARAEADCNKDIAIGCWRRQALAHVYIPPLMGIRKLELLEKSCRLDARYCFSAGYALNDRPNEAEKRRGLAAWMRGCDAGYGLACGDYGRKIAYSKPALAKAALDKACRDDASLGCYSLGQVYAGEYGGKADFAKARDAYRFGCNRNARDPSCRDLALMLWNGQGGPVDQVEARRLAGKCGLPPINKRC